MWISPHDGLYADAQGSGLRATLDNCHASMICTQVGVATAVCFGKISKFDNLKLYSLPHVFFGLQEHQITP